MANDTDQPSTALATTQPQARPVKVYEPVADVVPIFDTARFEHYQRVATVMAAASLIPDDLRGQGGPQAVGNCFLVVSLADRLGMDPFMLAQGCSVVHGRLMLEGKVVNAGIQNKLRARLNFYYQGDRGTEGRRIYVSREPLTEDEVKALKPGVYPFGHEDMIDGSVGEWQTRERNGGVKAAWLGAQADIQLRYRGTRTWARVNEPGIMLGVYAEEEFDDLIERRESAQRVAHEGPKRSLIAGFGDDTDQIVKKAPQTAEAAPAAEGAAEGDKAAEAQPTGQEEAKSAEPEPDAAKEWEDRLLQRHNEGAEAAMKGDPREAPADFEEEEEAAHWLEGWDDKAKELAAEENAEKTVAPPDVVYMIVGEGFSTAGRRKTYKNGFSFSSVGEKGAANIPVYDLHTPLAEGDGKAEGGKDQARPTETAGAPNAETKPDTSGSASGASAASQEETSGAQPSAEASKPSEPEKTPEEIVRTMREGGAPADDDSFPGDRPATGSPEAQAKAASAQRADLFRETNEKIVASGTWLEIKQHLRAISETEAYRDAEDEGKRMLRLWAYDAYKELREGGKETVEPSADITLFRFWLEFDADSEEQITALFRSLHRSAAYAGATEEGKRQLGEMIARRKAALGGAK